MFVFIGLLSLALFHQALGAGGALPSVDFLRVLKSSPTEVERQAQLANDSKFNYVFDFMNATVGVSAGKGGRVVGANVSTAL